MSSEGRWVHWAAALVCACVGALWSGVVFLAGDANEVSPVTGIVAALAAGAALFFASAEGSSWVGPCVASPTALALISKPFVSPMSYSYGGRSSTFSPTAETHLWFMGPGVLLGVLALGLLLVPTWGDHPSRRALRTGLRIVGGVLGILASTGLLLVFFDGRSASSNLLSGLGASAAVGSLSLAAMIRGEPPLPPAWGTTGSSYPAATTSPYRGLPTRGRRSHLMARDQVAALHSYGSKPPWDAPTRTDTDELLLAVARAPAPGVHALQGLLELPAGSRVGSFLIQAKLGAGGMGIVYRARDERLGREVALKLLPQHLASDPTRRARFFREARMAATVQHANVATIFELGETSPPFIAMELVAGESLGVRLARGLPEAAEARRIALAVASGLAAAHARGVIHRDLKPENVMIAEDGTPKLVDFGLARAMLAEDRSTMSAAKTRDGWVLGTPRYMAPEQAAGGEVDSRVDVYAFGLLLVDLANGVGLDPATPAFRRAEAAEDVLRRTLPALAPVAARCLAFAPDGRYESGSALAAALRDVG